MAGTRAARDSRGAEPPAAGGGAAEQLQRAFTEGHGMLRHEQRELEEGDGQEAGR